MCVYSMAMDHYRDIWEERKRGLDPFVSPLTPLSPFAPTAPVRTEPAITDEEIREFRKLLERARKYDKEHGEPDCELGEKKDALRALAKQLGVDITFPDEATAWNLVFLNEG